MKISYYAKTDVGVVRTENQDSYGINSEKNLFIVCDGMGGGAAGAFASKTAVEVMLKSFDKLTLDNIIAITGNGGLNSENLRPAASIMLANRYLNNLTLKYPKLKGMGTTAVAVKFEPELNLLRAYHTGDSRVYRLRAGVLELLTKDHSKINELIDAGKMKEEDVKSAEIQSMITRAVGTEPTVKVDYTTYETKEGDCYVLCSDGLNSEIDDSLIKEIIEKNINDLASLTNNLIISANKAGGKDNTTVIALKIETDGQTQTPTGYTNTTITISDNSKKQYLCEDKLLSNFAKFFVITIPKEAKDFRISPFVIALFISIVAFAITLIYSNYSKEKQKDFTEITGKVSGITLDIRELKKNQLELINSAPDMISKLELLQNAVKQENEETIPLPEVQVLMQQVDGPNKFVGTSELSPISIKLPAGIYILSLKYPGFKILDENYNLADSLKLSIELSESLKSKTVIMLPEKREDSHE
ncbi:MAG: protein phosphatase 2C domain-containing protein [Endomicrobium sp.]|jgi:protein phosphatase|nr:protein phosphatase 2C domain-containing protein [Endomicrobium sp.]MDR2818047.1 protein phosphatase 2C domain-containing protein [Endomicrobium sp.]